MQLLTASPVEIGWFGLTANPVHVGHLVCAQTVADKFKMTELLLGANGIPPHKEIADVLPGPVRLKHLKLCLEGNPVLKASDLEINRACRTGQPSYTSDTLQELTVKYDAVYGKGLWRLNLVMGDDVVLEFCTWHDTDVVKELARLIIYPRAGAIDADKERMLRHILQSADVEIVNPQFICSASSSFIRQMIKSGSNAWRYLVREKVYEDIVANRYYLDPAALITNHACRKAPPAKDSAMNASRKCKSSRAARSTRAKSTDDKTPVFSTDDARSLPLLFSTESGSKYVKKIAATGGFERGRVTRRLFPDGERYLRLRSQVMSRHVAVVGEVGCDADALELFDLSCAITRYGARSLTVLVAYTTDSISKDRQKILKAVPESQEGNRVVPVQGSYLLAAGYPDYKSSSYSINDCRRLLVFSTTSYKYLANRIVSAERSRFELGTRSAARIWIDAHTDEPVGSDVRGREVIVVGGTISDAATLELYRLACELVAEGARTLTLVIPYFGCSTMERAVCPGEVVTAKTRAVLLSCLPRAPKGNRIALMDLHSEGIPHYFEGAVGTYHIYCESVIARTIKRLSRGRNCVIGSADGGRSKWVQSYADRLDMGVAIVIKRRLSSSDTKVCHVLADVKGKTVFLFDDMVRTGGSALGAAKAYIEAGAASVVLICTHGVLPGDSLKDLVASRCFERIVVTDTHPRTLELEGKDLTVVSVAGLIAGKLSAGLKL